MTLVRIRTTPPRRAWLAPLALLVVHVALAQGLHTTAHVTRVIDGDTIAVTLADGESATVRLLGIDTPELGRDGRAAQPFAEAARDFTRRLVGGRVVQLAADPRADQIDRYGRILRYVYLRDVHLNAALVDRGLARAFRRFSYSQQPAFLFLEAQARAARRGLWAAP